VPTDVETAYNLLEAQLRATNIDGTSGQTGTLTVYLADAVTTVSCTARFEDLVQSDATRGPYHLQATLSFTQLSEFL
jgi:hypothetical protein